ncbi:MAG: hypothetical protein ACE5HD_07710 [Acidobacteriota bacterium]
MSRFESWLLSLSTLLAGGTGLCLYVLKTWLATDDPFSVVRHPWQPWVLKAHLVAVPFLIFAFGLVFSTHVLAQWQKRRPRGRLTGLWVTGLFAPLVLSGVLIQVLTAQVWLDRVVWIHLASGILYLGLYAGHRWSTRSLPARKEAPERRGLAVPGGRSPA